MPRASCSSSCGACRSASRRVQSYVFVSEIAEVTQAFNTYTVDRAIDWALKASPVDYHCRSDFGYAFNRFSHTEIESLDRKTTVLILGDARNNYNDPQAWAIRQIRERVKGIIWLNPEGQWGWGIGDSVMPLYAPACDIVKECRTMGAARRSGRSARAPVVAAGTMTRPEGAARPPPRSPAASRRLGRRRASLEPRVEPPRRLALELFVVRSAARVAVSFRGAPSRCAESASRSRISRRARWASFRRDGSSRADEGRGVYTIQEEGGRRFLHAASRGHRDPGREGDRPGTSPGTRCSRGRGGPSSFRRARTSAIRRRTTARWPSTVSFPTAWDRSDR